MRPSEHAQERDLPSTRDANVKMPRPPDKKQVRTRPAQQPQNSADAHSAEVEVEVGVIGIYFA